MSLRFGGGEGGSDCFVLGLLETPVVVVIGSFVSLHSPALGMKLVSASFEINWIFGRMMMGSKEGTQAVVLAESG